MEKEREREREKGERERERERLAEVSQHKHIINQSIFPVLRGTRFQRL